MFVTHIVRWMLENENSKRIRTSLETVCNERKAQWMQTLFHCKGRFGTMRMHARTLRDLETYESNRCILQCESGILGIEK